MNGMVFCSSNRATVLAACHGWMFSSSDSRTTNGSVWDGWTSLVPRCSDVEAALVTADNSCFGHTKSEPTFRTNAATPLGGVRFRGGAGRAVGVSGRGQLGQGKAGAEPKGRLGRERGECFTQSLWRAVA